MKLLSYIYTYEPNEKKDHNKLLSYYKVNHTEKTTVNCSKTPYRQEIALLSKK